MIRIVTDSASSIPADEARERDIEVLSLYVNRDGIEYDDATMDVDAFYADIADMVDDIPTSSQPSLGSLMQRFEAIAEAGDALLGIFMSSKMSGTFETALRAARAVAANHLDFEYRIVDTTSNSFDEAYAVFDAADERAKGGTLQRCAEAAARAVASSRFLFTPETLAFLRAGGRIGNAAALLGNLVKICPIITVRDGESTTFAKVRTHKKALVAMAQKCREDIAAYGLKRIVVHYIGDSAEARAWGREAIEPIAGHAVRVHPVNPVIGVHVGPAVAVAYECAAPIPDKLSYDPMELICGAPEQQVPRTFNVPKLLRLGRR